MVEEDYFPRGKPKIDPASAEAEQGAEKKDKKFVNVFSEKDGKVVKDKKKKKAKGTGKKKESDESVITVKVVPDIRYKELREGMVISGIISEVNEYEVKLSLPCHIVATLPITNISSTLTEILRKLANDDVEDEDEKEEIPNLDQIFKVGQFLVVAVVSCDLKHNKYELKVSTDPKLVMAGRVPGDGDLCVASVMSKEDHGYIMDVGNKSVRGFLPNKAAQKHWTDSVYVGMMILCQVVKKDKGAVTLRCDPGKVYNTVKAEPNLHNTLPGTLFKAKIVSALENGLKVEFGSDLTGYLSRDLLPAPTDNHKDFNVGAEINVRLVHVVPTVNTVLLSARSVFPIKTDFGDVKSGDVVKEASVVRVAQRHLVIKVNDDILGFVSARNAKETADTIKNLKEKFKVGQTVKARVLGLDYFGGVAACTLHKTLVKGINKLDQLTIGQKIRGTVLGFVDRGLEVTVGPNLTGFIPTVYLSDVPLKHPEKKFHKGDKIDCRVLLINLEKNRLHLTSKPILVKEDFSVVSSYETAVVGTITEGVVVKISKDGLLVNLFGDMRGFAPKRALSTETIEFPEKLFFIGQAVKCQVIGCEPEKKRISLSLVIGSMNPLGKKQRQKGKVLVLGNKYLGKVSEVTEDGLDVDVVEDDKTIKCTIPTNHLTDNIAVAKLLLQAYQVGDEVTGLCFNHDVVTHLTMKQTVIDACQAGTLPEGFDDIEIGSVLPSAVQTIKPFGVFCKMPTWSYRKTVLVPTRNIANFFVEKPEDVLDIGQTLMVKVTEKDDEGQKLAGTTNLKDFVVDGSECAAMTKSLLRDLDFIRSKDERLGKIRIGNLLTGTIKEISTTGAILDVNGIIGLAPSSSLGPECKLTPGDRVPVMVLFVDYQAGVMEVSLDTNIIHKSAMCSTTPQVGFGVKGRVVLTRTELNLQLVAVTNPTKFAGCLVFVSTISHINDLVGDKAEVENRPINVVIQHVDENEIIGVNEKHIRASNKNRNKNKRDRTNSIGDESNLLKRMRTESESSVKAEVKATETADFIPPKPVAPSPTKSPKSRSDPDLEKSLKKKEKKKKKKKEKEENENEEEAMDITVEESNEATMEEPKQENNPEQKVGITDPGWDFSLTGVTLPAWGKVSIWGEDEEDEDSDETPKKHVGKKEAKALRREEAAAAEVAEKKVVLGEHLPPQSAQEFEKLVLSSPNSSLVWIQYMAFHLQTCQYDQARAVAARAVERINFREEGERLNVFLAWLNLENTFGNQETLAGVLKDALQRNDEFKVYSQMADIYTKSGKMEEAEKIFKVLVKKFCKVKEVWIRFGLFYYKNSRTEEGRFVFTRSLQNLELKDATDISAKFAQIEFRYGDAERGKTMYEKLVLNHPKRIDLWSSYTDQLVRVGDISATRVLYNRIATLGLQAKKMKPLFGKWLEFEKIHGTDEQQGIVKQAALQYLNSRGSGTVGDPTEA